MIRKKIVQNQEEGKNRGPLTVLKRMVTIPRKLNMNHFKVHLTSESGKYKRIRWSQEEKKGVLWCFTYIKEKTLGENYKEAYKLWRERNTITRMNIDAKALLNQKNYFLTANRITAVEIDEIKENIRLKIRNDTEDYLKGVNGDRMDTNVAEHQKRDQESKNTVFYKVENNSQPSAGREQHTVRNKLKEDFQIMWHGIR